MERNSWEILSLDKTVPMVEGPVLRVKTFFAECLSVEICSSRKMDIVESLIGGDYLAVNIE